MWGNIAHEIPPGWRICGENLFAEHSIHYRDLASYFYVFSVWNEKNICLSWDETVEWATLLGFPTVRVLNTMKWNSAVFMEQVLEGSWLYPNGEYLGHVSEGYVVRNTGEFHYKDFRRNVAKYVRANHVQHKDGHWVNRRVIPNELKK